jgi:hypothetical protein
LSLSISSNRFSGKSLDINLRGIGSSWASNRHSAKNLSTKPVSSEIGFLTYNSLDHWNIETTCVANKVDSHSITDAIGLNHQVVLEIIDVQVR